MKRVTTVCVTSITESELLAAALKFAYTLPGQNKMSVVANIVDYYNDRYPHIKELAQSARRKTGETISLVLPTPFNPEDAQEYDRCMHQCINKFDAWCDPYKGLNFPVDIRESIIMALPGEAKAWLTDALYQRANTTSNAVEGCLLTMTLGVQKETAEASAALTKLTAMQHKDGAVPSDVKAAAVREIDEAIAALMAAKSKIEGAQ